MPHPTRRGRRTFLLVVLPALVGLVPLSGYAAPQSVHPALRAVRPGEAPYHPMIRFQIRPDGLRSYYVVYPLLEGLGVPMTRENLE